MPLGFDGHSQSSNNGSSTFFSSQQVSHAAGGTERLALLILHSDRGLASPSFTVDGNAAQIIHATGHVYLAYYVAPPTSTVIYRFSCGTNYRGSMHVLTYTGVDQSNPVGSDNETSGSGTNPSINVASVESGNWVAAFLSHEAGGTGGPSSTSGNTRYTRGYGLSNDEFGNGQDDTGSGGSKTMSWQVGSPDSWWANAVEINAAPDDVTVSPAPASAVASTPSVGGIVQSFSPSPSSAIAKATGPGSIVYKLSPAAASAIASTTLGAIKVVTRLLGDVSFVKEPAADVDHLDDPAADVSFVKAPEADVDD